MGRALFVFYSSSGRSPTRAKKQVQSSTVCLSCSYVRVDKFEISSRFYANRVDRALQRVSRTETRTGSHLFTQPKLSAVVHLIRGSSWRTNQMARLTATGVVAGQPNERGSDEPDIHSRPSRGARFYLPQIRASESGITTNLRLVVLVSG
jgi:hypothetical protein